MKHVPIFALAGVAAVLSVHSGAAQPAAFELSNANVDLAVDAQGLVNGVTGERIDLERQRADAADAQAERARITAEEQAGWTRMAAEKKAKEDAAEAARQKRYAPHALRRALGFR